MSEKGSIKSDTSKVTRSQTKHLRQEDKDKLVLPGLVGPERQSTKRSHSNTSQVSQHSKHSKEPSLTDDESSNEHEYDKPDDNKITESDIKIDVPEVPKEERINILIQDCEKMAQQQENKYIFKPRDALDMIPIFTNEPDSCSLNTFILALQSVKSILPDDLEATVTKMIISQKLKGEPYALINDTTYDKIVDLIKAIQNYCNTNNTTVSLCGEITKLLQLPNESVSKYLRKAKDLRNRIIETVKQEHNLADAKDARVLEMEKVCTKYFIRGLRKDIRPEMKETENLNKAGLEAIEIESMLQNQDRLYTNLLPKTCTLCKNTGHTPEYCTLLTQTLNKEPSCQLCQKSGHTAINCKDKYFCQICDKPGHTATACRETQKGTHCQICKRNGHTALECHFTPVHITKESPVCQLCHKAGHTSDRCLQNTKCFKCDKFGHYSRNCRAQIYTHQYQNTTRYCQFCKTNTHNTQECRSRNKTRIPRTTCSYCKKSGHEIQTCFIKAIRDIQNSRGNSQSLPAREAANRNPFRATQVNQNQ